jgi:hypothetical protein
VNGRLSITLTPDIEVDAPALMDQPTVVLLLPYLALSGGGGGGGGNYQHTQAGAATTWVVNHNLGFRPNVQVLTAGGAEMLAEVLHTSVNQVQVFFDDPRAGLAVCS